MVFEYGKPKFLMIRVKRADQTLRINPWTFSPTKRAPLLPKPFPKNCLFSIAFAYMNYSFSRPIFPFHT